MKVTGLVWSGTRTAEFGPMLAFCRDVLGMSPAALHRNFAALDMPNGDRFEIFGADSPYNTFMTHPVVGFATDDLAAARAEMEAYGIEFIEPIQTEKDGSTWCHFRAPDGFLYSLSCPSAPPTR